MKEQTVTKKMLINLREIFNNKGDVKQILKNIDEAEKYLYENVEKNGLFEFAAKIMDTTIKIEFPEENILACKIFNDLDSQLIGNSLS